MLWPPPRQWHHLHPSHVGNSIFAAGRSRDATDAAINRIESDHGHLDILVNNAGYGDGKTGAEATNAEWDEIIEIDLNACFRLARRAHVGMARRG